MNEIYIGMARTLAENSLQLAEPKKELEYCIKYIDNTFQLSNHERTCMIQVCSDHINKSRYNKDEG